MTIPTASLAASIALFPKCGNLGCRTSLIPSVSGGSINGQVGDAPAQTIPGNQDARLLRFLWLHRHEYVIWDDLYMVLRRSGEVDRCLSSLRNKRLIPIPCTLVDKANGRGKIGIYRLGDNVKVWEPGTAVEGGKA